MKLNIFTILPLIACLIMVSCSKSDNESISFSIEGKLYKRDIEPINVIDKYPSGKNKIIEFESLVKENEKYQIRFYENGLREKEGVLIGGKKNGVWKYFKENGRSGGDINYVNGEINGNVYEVDSDGGIRFVGYQIMGELDGHSTYFWKNGVPGERGKWKLGKRIGVWEYFNKDGSLKRIDTLRLQ